MLSFIDLEKEGKYKGKVKDGKITEENECNECHKEPQFLPNLICSINEIVQFLIEVNFSKTKFKSTCAK